MFSVPSSEASQRDCVILAHLPQVRLIAARMHRHCPRHVEIDDLVSAGIVGLIQAVDRFRPDRGCKLKTLAEHRIRGAILDYLRKLDPLPRSVRRFVRQRDEAAIRLQGQLGRTPESTELAEALDLPIEQYRHLEWSAGLRKSFASMRSGDAALRSDDGPSTSVQAREEPTEALCG